MKHFLSPIVMETAKEKIHFFELHTSLNTMHFTFRKLANENCSQGTFTICHQKLKSPVRNHFGTANFIQFHTK